ncbi:MAG: acylphosphatase [Gemmatimonadales bacterium]
MTSDETRVEIRLIVTGNVQGVGFRAFLRETARALGVKGWTRNLPDGSVELEAGGEEATMAAFTRRVGAGPGWAQIDYVLEGPRHSSGPLPDPFTIVR